MNYSRINNPKMAKWILLISRLHTKLVYSRRTKVLALLIAKAMPDGGRMLDLGCGDGMVSSLVMKEMPKCVIYGVDVKRRAQTAIPIHIFDGRNLPLKESSFDAILIIDVLHHAENAKRLLREALRVTRRYIIIKDHFLRRGWDRFILQFMDWVGNRSQDVVLPYNYQI